jgi:hypothetical protein
MIIEIENVSCTPLDNNRFWGAAVNHPRSGEKLDIYALELEGWVLSRTSPAATVDVLEKGVLLYRVPVKARRRDRAAAFPEVPEAGNCGFRAGISALNLPATFELRLQVELEDGARMELAVIRGRRNPLQLGAPSRLLPLPLTTLGRTGSTWLVTLLAQHPQVLAYRPFDYETRVSSYWLAVLKALAEPCSYTQSFQGELYPGSWWLGDQRPSPVPRLPEESPLQLWLGRDHIRDLADFCRNRIEAFFQQVAVAQERAAARFFVEKFYPDRFQTTLLAELFPQGRELFLVRDFRDMCASMLAYSAKLGRPSFGRELTKTDEEFIWLLREQAVRMLESWQERKGRGCLVRYEDLIERPADTLHALLHDLGLDSSGNTVGKVLSQAAQVKPLVQREHQTSAGPADSVGRWRQDLSPSLQALCREALGDTLAAFGYPSA